MTPSETSHLPPPPAASSHHHCYAAIPPQPHDEECAVLPCHHTANPRRNRCVVISILLISLAANAYIFWPSHPQLMVERLHLTHIHIHSKPVLCVDIALRITLKVQNPDVYSMDYQSLEVSIGYRGKKMGHVRSNQGHVRALASSYVDAELELECVKMLSDLVFLLEDLARGVVPFDTVTEVSGQLGLFFFEFPLKVNDEPECRGMRCSRAERLGGYTGRVGHVLDKVYKIAAAKSTIIV